ncbi:MAG TPA: hypothetical protein VF532_12260 [Candidatus Angelobacter sp.]
MFNTSHVALSPQPLRALIWRVCFGTAFLLPLSGCATMNLNKLTITSMAASVPKGPSIAPGEKFPLLVTMTQPDGKVLSTEDEAEERISWKDLDVAASVVTVDKKGNVSLSADPRLSDGQLPHVIITVPSHPDLRAEFDIPVRYDRKFSANFQGSSGFSGLDGASGHDGSSGSPGSFDPDHPVAGGNGGDGTNGSDGEDGKPGSDGPPVQVRVALRSGSHPLLQVGVFAQNKQKFFLVDPQGGFLVVTSEGGSGGSGGRGGRGGRGGSGGAGSPPGRSGSDGLSGHDGRSGWSGNGGSITVTCDPEAKPFLFAIRLSNPGGPRPVFKEEPVDRLW